MMNSIDLIPNDYRESALRSGRLRIALWIAVIICTFVVLGSYLLAKKARDIKAESDQIRQKFALGTLYSDQISTLDDRLKELNEEWLLLSGLRAGAAAEDLFIIIDQALPGEDVWFNDWTFRRAGVILPDTDQVVGSSYFIVVANDSDREAEDKWRVETHMDISGQAKDHAALSKFVRGLYDQREIQDVKLSQTRVTQYADRSVVDFKLAVVLYSEPAA
ncbi:MAG: PilN domain-containing protein [Gammaproteobacteria bacterium]